MFRHHTSQPTAPLSLSSHPGSATKWQAGAAQFDPGQNFGAIPFHGAAVLMEVELQHFVCWHFAFAAALLNLVIAQF